MARGSLFLVATPIGNDDDLGRRARRVLEEVPLVAAEDTRVTAALLRRLGIAPPRMVSLHDHNEAKRAPELVAALEEGDVALVSDAGTPLVSDPGYRVVRAALDAGFPVVPIPGPCAFVAAVAASGLPSDRILFRGFLPRQAGPRRRALEELRTERATLVVYEAPHRILAALEDVDRALGERRVCVAASLSKVWERFHRGTPRAVRDALAAEGELKGEMTLVIAGCADRAEDAAIQARARDVVGALARAGVAPGVIRDAVAAPLGISRRDAYQVALEALAGRG